MVLKKKMKKDKRMFTNFFLDFVYKLGMKAYKLKLIWFYIGVMGNLIFLMVLFLNSGVIFSLLVYLFWWFVWLGVKVWPFLVQELILVVPILLSVAITTLIERKIMAAMQRRSGPNVVGLWGLFQPFADGLKLILKETIMPGVSNKFLFLFSPVLTFSLSLLSWVVVPFSELFMISDINVSLLYILSVSSVGVYGVVCAGWSSNSQYAFLGALSSAAQMMSYEVSMGLIIICVVLCAGSLSLVDIVLAQQDVWYVFPLYPLFILFFISVLAETNRPPFDLPEAEAELVSGYNVEYSGLGFALFFIGEYANILFMSILCVMLFLGGWLDPLSILSFIPGSFWVGMKVCFIVFCFVWVRASFPSFRYDQLMRLGWKVIFPLSLGFVIFYGGLLYGMGWLYI